MRATPAAFVIAMILFPTLWVSGAPAGREDPSTYRLFLEPLLEKGFGGVAYDLDYDEGGGWTGLSRLEFPHIPLEAGAVLGLTFGSEEHRRWMIELEAAHSVVSVTGEMNDYDWDQLSGYAPWLWSSTSSKDSTVSWHVSASVAWTVLWNSPWQLALYGMYRYDDMSHVEDGITGWQYASDGSLYVFDETTPDVLEYSLASHMIGVGILGEVAVTNAVSFQVRAAFTPVHISDRDDHVLRYKLSTAEGWGAGVYVVAGARWRLPQMGPSLRPYLALDGKVIYYVVDTTQRQEFYAGPYQGTIYTDIGHTVTATQFSLALRVGFLL